jgi:protease IV
MHNACIAWTEQDLFETGLAGARMEGGDPMNQKAWRGGVILAIVVFLLIIGLLFRSVPGPGMRPGVGTNRVKIIYIEGIIAGGQSGASFLGSVTGSDLVIRQLKAAREDSSVKAVVLRINSPGGTSAASEEIGIEVRKLRDSGKPVVASMGDVAASGGYWVAAYADRIVANAATTTGSIGVISQISNYEELYEKLGIEFTIIKSGEYKDIGRGTRSPSTEEVEILQSMVDDVFDQFISVVAEGRDMSPQRVRELADGRVYTGRQAKELGLVDEIGNFYSAIDLAASLAGIEGRYLVDDYRRVHWWELLFSQSDSFLNGPERSRLVHQFLLLYQGSTP